MATTMMRRNAAWALLLVTANCGLLDVSDPTAVEDEDVATATGADYLRRDAITRLFTALGEAVITTGNLSDELLGRDLGLDQRKLNATGGYGAYTMWKEAHRAATLAIPQLLKSGAPGARRPYVGEMFAVRGYATLGLGEGFCPGAPLHEIIDFQPVYGPPLSTDEMFERALADFDSAGAYAADSVRILNLARIGRGRALLGLGRFAEAAEAVNLVPTAYTWNAEFASSQWNYLGLLWKFNQLISVGNREGDNGMDFVEANDPRLRIRAFTTIRETTFYKSDKVANESAPIVIANGVEARLIEAEAALQSNNANWLTILNDLRTSQVTPAMAPLADPGSDATRTNMVFRERAFWLFLTAHRLGDMRRLVSRYGRASEDVFPTGPFYRNGFKDSPDGTYETATSMQFPAALETPYSSAVSGCTDR